MNGELEEEIFTDQLEGFVIHGQDNKVCKLDNLIISNDFEVNESDKCIYYKSKNNIYTIICLYVDDLLVFYSNIHVGNNMKSLLCANFDMKDLGEVKVILRIKII